MPYQKIVQEFGKRLGISHFEADIAGPVTFELQDLGALTLELTADERELLLTLSLPLSFHDSEKLLTALKMCHPDRIRPFPLACGLHREALLLVSRRSLAGSSAAGIENQAIFLLDCAKELGIQ
ncbi:MAG: CesT family type III secretion system chaperone [Zoogloeaceae bacterium]|jgi:type III secretion system chaperone SycN|nr:CesT family type III secretion system chaperone [Zoogloeaceae bacterium]